MYINIDSVIIFIGMSAVTAFVWYGIAHVSTYFEVKERYIKPEFRNEVTFLKYTASEIKRYFTGKGMF